MRKLLPICLIAFFLSTSFGTADAQTAGGPDTYGYTWKDSNDPNGPTYSWVDITTKANATQIPGLGDDNSVGVFSIGWNFAYYWNLENEVKIGSNGWVGFDNIGNIASCYPTIPTQGGAGDNYLAPFMSDLNFTSNNASFTNPATLWTWTNGADSFVVTFKNVPWWKNDGGGANPPNFNGDNTFQVILSGADSSITFQYQSTTPSAWYDSPGCADDMVIGIENVTGNIGLMLPTNVIPVGSYAVRFEPPATPGISISDPTPAWNANSDNQGQFFISNQIVGLKTNIANVGNADLTTATTVTGEVKDIPLNTIYTSSASVADLLAGEDTTITFSPTWNIGTPGQYYFDVGITNNDDINLSNNTNSVEISAVDCFNDTMALTYATGNGPDASISWAGGGQDGVGIYIDPPIHPVTIESIEYYIVGDGDPGTNLPVGFLAKVYEEDMNGNPGNQLFTQTIDSLTAVEDAWNVVVLPNPVTITSGGFYAAWLQESNGIGLGTESFGPISRRTYEVLSNSWATYRSGSSTDFLIKVNVSTDCSVGREDELTRSNLELFPNPSATAATLRWDRAKAGSPTIAIINPMGQKVFEKVFGWSNAGNMEYALPVANLPAGTYFVTVTENDQVLTRKMVVTR